jgi:polysaccharide export outer membrane protein
MSWKWILTGVLLAPCVPAQEPDAANRMRQLTSLPTIAAASDKKLGPGDLVEISVLGVSDLSQLVRIGSGGIIAIPILGSLTAGGLTPLELQERIASMLKERELVRDPQVSVFIREFRSQPVYVLGAVNQPGQYMATTEIRLLDALSLAGGLDLKRAAGYLLIQRRRERADRPRAPLQFEERESIETAGRIKINLTDLLDNGDLSLNVPLEAGDVIQVPEKETEQFYVVGDVQRPGAFPFGAQRSVTVLTALSFAGGFGRTAKPERARILREVSGQRTRQHIEVDIRKVMLGKAEDIALRPEDLLVIPTSGSKTFQTYVLPAAVATSIGSLIWAGFAR